MDQVPHARCGRFEKLRTRHCTLGPVRKLHEVDVVVVEPDMVRHALERGFQKGNQLFGAGFWGTGGCPSTVPLLNHQCLGT